MAIDRRCGEATSGYAHKWRSRHRSAVTNAMYFNSLALLIFSTENVRIRKHMNPYSLRLSGKLDLIFEIAYTYVKRHFTLP